MGLPLDLRGATLTHENVENLVTAPNVWGELMDKHPEISAWVYQIYNPVPHGTRAQQENKVIPRDLLKSYLSNGEWPKIGDISDKLPIFALSSVVDTSTLGYVRQGEWEDGINRIVQPKAFVVTDLEFPISSESLKYCSDIVSPLHEDWWITNTGNGGHLIIDKLVDPVDLPQNWGKLIEIFAIRGKVPDPEPVLLLAHKLQVRRWTFGNKNIATELRREFPHIGDTLNSGRVFSIDLNYISHSIDELDLFMKNKTLAIANLRISNYPGRDSIPPVLAAKKVGNNITFYDSANNSINKRS